MMNGDLICTLLAVLNWRVTVEEQILRGEGQIKISGSPALKKIEIKILPGVLASHQAVKVRTSLKKMLDSLFKASNNPQFLPH